MLKQLKSSVVKAAITLETPTVSELHRRYERDGIKRWGIAAVLLTRKSPADEPNILIQQYVGNEKVTALSWGGLGETSKIAVAADGHVLAIEPTTTTLLRGVAEETGVSLPAKDFMLPRQGTWFDSSWPVGLQFLGQRGGVRCPVAIISSDAAEAMISSPSNSEILQREFVSLKDAALLARDAQFGQGLVRLGFRQWIHEIDAHLAQINLADVSPMAANEQWLYADSRATTDAVLDEIYGSID
jgi:hypothetical protein